MNSLFFFFPIYLLNVFCTPFLFLSQFQSSNFQHFPFFLFPTLSIYTPNSLYPALPVSLWKPPARGSWKNLPGLLTHLQPQRKKDHSALIPFLANSTITTRFRLPRLSLSVFSPFPWHTLNRLKFLLSYVKSKTFCIALSAPQDKFAFLSSFLTKPIYIAHTFLPHSRLCSHHRSFKGHQWTSLSFFLSF